MEINLDKVYLGLGTNLGERLDNLAQAIAAIEAIPETRLTAQSSIYETQPRFYTAQPNFLNACVAIETRLSPLDLLKELQAIEYRLGRARSIPNGPRTIDLDILLYGKRVLNEEDLVVPHPGLHTRAFVLVPLAEVMSVTAAELRHPVVGQSIPDLLGQLPTDAPDIGWVRKFEQQLESNQAV